jgi:hypothetical protein
MGKKKNAQGFLEGKHKGKKLLGRPRQKYENNIKMDLKNWMGEYWLN